MNNTKTTIPTPETPNKNFLKESVEAILPVDKIKQKLGDLNDEWKDDRVEPVKTQDDQEKLTIYGKLEVKDLPFDWKNQLARLKHLETQQVDYNQIKEDLKGWTDIFLAQTPQEIQAKVNKLKTWTDTFGDQTAEEVETNRSDLVEKLQLAENVLEQWDRAFLGQNAQQVKQQKEQTERELTEWKETWGNRELSKVQEEYEILKKRPMLTITEKQFFDDYARREALNVSKKRKEELARVKQELQDKIQQFKILEQAVDRFLDNERTRRYVLMKPVITPEEAQRGMTKLLTETEQSWTDYLQNGSENYRLDFSLKNNEPNKAKVQEILTWIREARKTKNYQQLFENWSGSSEYNENSKKYDFDGSLYLLTKYLETK